MILLSLSFSALLFEQARQRSENDNARLLNILKMEKMLTNKPKAFSNRGITIDQANRNSKTEWKPGQ
jgi:hypothetical protein